jgi:hypothetical protein
MAVDQGESENELKSKVAEYVSIIQRKDEEITALKRDLFDTSHNTTTLVST